MKKIKNILYISIILICLVIIFLVLFNTIFYDYKGKLNNYLTTYFASKDNNIDNINNMIQRYKNNTNRTNNINIIIKDYLDNQIIEYNVSYSKQEELDSKKNLLNNKYEYLLDNINLDVKENKDEYISTINSLYNSKSYYIKGLEYFNNNNNYSEAYDNLKNVIASDITYEETTRLIDKCFEEEVNQIRSDINNLKVFDNNTQNEDKLSIYKSIIDYLNNKKEKVKFDLTKSKTYNDIVKEISEEVESIYLEITNNLVKDNKYSEAILLLSEGINLLTKSNIDANKLINQKDEYLKMEPIDLTSLVITNPSNYIKEELALVDYDNKSYSKSIAIYKKENANIIYNLNKEYKYLTLSVNKSNEVNEKNKYYGRVKIYGDNKVLYNSNDININFKYKELKLDISNINELKIEYTLSSRNNTSKDNVVVLILGNPTLHKY